MQYLIGLAIIIFIIYWIVRFIIWVVPKIAVGVIVILIVGGIAGLLVGVFYGIKNYMASTHENINNTALKIAMMVITSVFVLGLLGNTAYFAVTNGGEIVSNISNIDVKNMKVKSSGSKVSETKVVDVDELKVYKKAASDAGVAFVLPQNTTVEVTQIKATGWSKIRYEKKTGWVRTSNLRDPGDPFTNKIVDSDALNVRAGPSGNADIKFVLYKGDTVKVYDGHKSDGWVKIEHNNREGYVAERLLREVK